MQIQAILFDLGNTLTKSGSFIEAYQRLETMPHIQAMGLDREALLIISGEIDKIIRELYQKDDYTQPHWFDVWQAAVINSGITLTDDQITALCYAHLQTFLEDCPVEPFAIPLLTTLKEHNIPLGLISNVTGPLELHAANFQRKGLAEFFDVTVWSNAVGIRKPDPRIFQFALDELDLKASKQILMVGDNESADIQGGNAMGFTTLKVVDGEIEEESDADYIVKKEEMISFFNSIIS
jgi:putative hydrolase of the HAD superfamily